MKPMKNVHNGINHLIQKIENSLMRTYGVQHNEDIKDAVAESILYYAETNNNADWTNIADNFQWLLGLSYNRLINKLNYKNQKKFYRIDIFETLDEITSENLIAELICHDNTHIEDRLTCISLITLLPKKESRLIILLKSLLELSYNDISQIMDITPQNARQLYCRAMKQLKQLGLRLDLE